MTIITFANLFNISGLAVLLFIAVLVSNKYPARFFRFWMAGYAGGLALLVSEAFAARLGHSFGLSVAEAAFCLSVSGCFFMMGQALRGRSSSWRVAGTYVGGLTAICAVESALGVPFMTMAIGPTLLETVSFIWIGSVLLRQREFAGGYQTRWVGVPMILVGLLPFTFPFSSGTRFDWVGYWAGGLLQIVTGAGMIILLLDGTASQLARRNEELLALDEMKDNFLATVSHELRTPLTAIKGAVWLVRAGLAGPITESQTELVTMISTNSERLIRLINDILDVSKMSSRTLSYQAVEADLRPLILTSCEDCRQLFEPLNIHFDVEVVDEPLVALADHDRITQVVVNLLSNASKFTPAGGQVTLRARKVDDDIRIEVADTGIGIPEESREKIFNRFFQVDGGAARRAGGTGLGLAICKAIVEDGHRGRIHVESTLGEGSTFIVTVPALQPAPLAAQPA